MNLIKPAIISITGLALLGLTACGQSTAQAPSPEAKKDEMAALTAIGVPSGTYIMDKTHGYVTFSYNHLSFSNPQLRFRDVDASIEFNADAPETSTVTATINAASIDSGVDVFDEHLNAEGFFNTAAHPKISFKSTSFTRADQNTGTMTGELNILGQVHELSFDVVLLAAKTNPITSQPTLGVEARTTISRTAWGLGQYAPAVSDDVDILITAEFNKAE